MKAQENNPPEGEPPAPAGEASPLDRTEAGDVRARIDAATLLRLFDGAEAFLSVRSVRLNNLNVFPVPDGDTGTNMLLTLRAAVQSARQAASTDIEDTAGALARGALLGARGNSGVILSQYLRGFAEGLKGVTLIDGADLARALDRAAQTAHAAITEPAEGTILTVAREVAVAALESAAAHEGLAAVLARAVVVADLTVERTPELLPALRQIRVVDAGALGLSTILDGLSRTLQGEPIPSSDDAADGAVVAAWLDLETYGFCTEFLIHGAGLAVTAIREELADLGNSLLVVGDPTLIRVHLHTFRPDQAVERARSHGSVDQIKIENMQEQNRRLRERDTSERLSLTPSALIAVASGAGFQRIFQSLGASGMLNGASASRPGAADFLSVIEAVRSAGCILLPNDPELFSVAEEAARRCDRSTLIIPSRDPAQGVIAALAFQPDRSLEENHRAMARALVDVRTGQITQLREARVGQGTAEMIAGTVDGCEMALGSEPSDVALRLLPYLKSDEAEALTVYAGAAAHLSDSAALCARIEVAYPHLQVDLVEGGQSQNLYILACE